MKVVAFNGSARKDGNTAILIEEVLERLGVREGSQAASPADDSSSLPITHPDSVRTYLTGIGLPADPHYRNHQCSTLVMCSS